MKVKFLIFLKNSIWLQLLILLSFFSILPFFQPGFFPIHDDTQVPRIFEMGKSLKDGMLPVRWVMDLGYGYGYPIFNFYSPFPYYIGGFINVIGADALLATKITFALGIILSGITMFYFVKSFLNNFSAFVSAIIYLYFPYHAVNIYIRGDLGEIFAYALIPLVFLGLYKIYFNLNRNLSFRENLKWILFSGFFTALVIISHNLSSFMLLLLLVLFFIVALFFSQNRVKLLVYYLAALVLSFLLSSFYAIPALLEMKYTNVISQIGGGANYLDHFVCPIQFWDSFWGYGGSIKGCIDGMSFKLGKVNIILMFFSMIMFLKTLIKDRSRGNKFLYISSLILLFFSIFMALDISAFFWNTIHEMAFIQYPWRFLNFIGFFTAFLIGLFVTELKNLFNHKIFFLFVTLIIIITLYYNAKLYQPKTYYLRDSNYYTDKTYINSTVSKISDEYMPPDFKKPVNINDIPNEPLEIIKGRGEINLLFSKTGFTQALINVKSNSLIKVNRAYFPAWKVLVNGKNVNSQILNDGIIFSLGSGKHKVDIIFKETFVEKIANILSLTGFIILIIGIIYIRRKDYAQKTS